MTSRNNPQSPKLCLWDCVWVPVCSSNPTPPDWPAVLSQTLRRCYSRVKEHGVGKRKSSYTFEQLEQVFGQGGWDSQPCQPVLINSSGLYQELESDGSTMEEYSQEDWGNHSQDLHCYQTGEQELGKKSHKSHLGTPPSLGFTCARSCLAHAYLSIDFHLSDRMCSQC